MFGALKYNNSCNLGDNIQTIAALQYLPRVDYWVDRDTGANSSSKKLIVIYNGWFNEFFWRTLPENIDPIFISFHLEYETHSNEKDYENLFEKHSASRNVENFKRMKGIVGCRDIYTMNYLRSNDINSYFSGCLTLTLDTPKVSKTDRVLVVDVDITIPWIKCIKNTFARSQITNSKTNEEKLKEAEELLKDIASSRLVITSRLHTALPSIAFKVPVIFVNKNMEDCRFEGLVDKIPFTTGEKCPIEDIETFTWDKMPDTKYFEILSESVKKTLKGILLDNRKY
jgi:Exopolysaccharide biosynthesis protein